MNMRTEQEAKIKAILDCRFGAGILELTAKAIAASVQRVFHAHGKQTDGFYLILGAKTLNAALDLVPGFLDRREEIDRPGLQLPEIDAWADDCKQKCAKAGERIAAEVLELIPQNA